MRARKWTRTLSSTVRTAKTRNSSSSIPAHHPLPPTRLYVMIWSTSYEPERPSRPFVPTQSEGDRRPGPCFHDRLRATRRSSRNEEPVPNVPQEIQGAYEELATLTRTPDLTIIDRLDRRLHRLRRRSHEKHRRADRARRIDHTIDTVLTRLGGRDAASVRLLKDTHPDD